MVPQFHPASSISLSTELRPNMVDDMIGYIEFQMIIEILGRSPIPINTINNGNRVIDGIFLVQFIIGITIEFITSFIEQATAITNPRIRETITPIKTIFMVYNALMYKSDAENILIALLLISKTFGMDGLCFIILHRIYAVKTTKRLKKLFIIRLFLILFLIYL